MGQKRTRITNKILTKMRYLREVEGMGDGAIAKAVGVSVGTVSKYRKQEGWGERGSLANAPEYPEGLPEPAAGPIEASDNVIQFPQDAAATIADLRAQLDAAKADIQKAEGKLFAPFIQTEDDLWFYVTPEALDARIEDRIYTEQNQRAGRGFAIIDPDSERWTAMFKRYRAEALKEAIDNQTKWAATELLGAAPPLKTVKMGRRRDDGTIETREIPYRADINSPSGNPADGIRKQQGKGWSVLDEFRCMTQNCYRPAALANGEFAHNGFCTPHRAWNVAERIRPDTTGTHLASSLRKVDWR